MYSLILVPYDGSAPSARSLPVAAGVARRTGAAVRVVVVHDPSAYIPFAPGEVAIPIYDERLAEIHRKADQQILDKAVTQLAASGVEASGVLLEGTVIEALLEYTASQKADLVVMGSHGRGGFERLRLGSVTTSYLTRSSVPTLLVPGSDSSSNADLSSGVLLCPLDGSPFAEQALTHAQTLAQAMGMRMHLIAVAVPRAVAMAPFGAEALLADSTAMQAEHETRETYLSEVAARCPEGTTWSAVSDMSVAQGLLAAARSMGASGMAVATHGRGGFKRLVLGSVTDELLRNSEMPVLVYRPQG